MPSRYKAIVKLNKKEGGYIARLIAMEYGYDVYLKRAPNSDEWEIIAMSTDEGYIFDDDPNWGAYIDQFRITDLAKCILQNQIDRFVDEEIDKADWSDIFAGTGT